MSEKNNPYFLQCSKLSLRQTLLGPSQPQRVLSGVCLKEMSISLAIIENNSKFKNKLKHTYLGRC